jgi:glycosyltransferase XagB
VASSSVQGAAVGRFKVAKWRTGGPPPAVVRHGRQLSRTGPKARPGICPEVDCVRDVLPRRVIAAAERRARSIGLGAERVLICADDITEEAYLAALAHSLGTTYEPLDRVSRAECPLNDHELIQAAAAGLMPLRQDGRLVWIIAPRGQTARRLSDPRQQQPRWLRPFRLTSSKHLQRFVVRHTQRALGRRATEGLHRAWPLFSNAPRKKGWRSGAAFTLLYLTAALFGIAPAATFGAFGTALCLVFLATAAIRLWCAFITDKAPKRLPHIEDDRLPIYTVICALYRESAVAGDLVAAIRALDYPPEKLDVKFVLEADDRDTRRALADLELGPPFEIITAPAIGPRTKPKALNVALPFARGSFTVVYDAEDAPEANQLRRAVAAFRSAGHRLACVQASLTIDNTADNWLARMFTAGYAGQFDVLLPGLAAMHLPFPLGGSSNHFRTAVLRKIGAWDPYNVTEDADLGIRLYRFGYRSRALPSATYEEAPARFTPWLKQRTRWYKGWMQTWLVHMRRPRRLMRELAPAGAFSFQLLLAGNVLAALVHPIFMAVLCYVLLAEPPLRAVGAMGDAAPVYAATLLAGYASTIVLDAIGLRRRGLLRHAWVLLLTPLYWFLLSLAAWRALFQLWRDPLRWEKTEHGLAKTSRMWGAGFAKPVSRPAVSGGTSPLKPLAPTAIMATPRGAMLEFPRHDRALSRGRN